MQKEKITKLTLAGMFAAMAFICFAYLRIEIPMGLGLTGKVYIGHTFIILSAIRRADRRGRSFAGRYPGWLCNVRAANIFGEIYIGCRNSVFCATVFCCQTA